MFKAVPVVIYLSRQPDRTECLSTLGRHSIWREGNFLLPEYHSVALEGIVSSLPQLLVVDMVSGSDAATAEFVTRAKLVNHKLRALLFSREAHRRSPYHDVLYNNGMTGRFENLAVEVAIFLDRYARRAS
jgi:hypothetical protein